MSWALSERNRYAIRVGEPSPFSMRCSVMRSFSSWTTAKGLSTTSSTVSRYMVPEANCRSLPWRIAALSAAIVTVPWGSSGVGGTASSMTRCFAKDLYSSMTSYGRVTFTGVIVVGGFGMFPGGALITLWATAAWIASSAPGRSFQLTTRPSMTLSAVKYLAR